MSSEKQKFVRNTAALFVAAHWEKPDAERAVRLALALWNKLSDHGYGDKDADGKKPRVSKDWYKELSLFQQKWFCAFMKAFAYQHGRNEAAMRWGQLGELTESEYEIIVTAAKAEAARPLPQGQVRKMAQGWLHERRWEDHAAQPLTATAKQADNPKIKELQDLTEKLHYAKQMYALDSDKEKWQAEIARLTSLITSIKTGLK